MSAWIFWSLSVLSFRSVLTLTVDHNFFKASKSHPSSVWIPSPEVCHRAKFFVVGEGSYNYKLSSSQLCVLIGFCSLYTISPLSVLFSCRVKLIFDHWYRSSHQRRWEWILRKEKFCLMRQLLVLSPLTYFKKWPLFSHENWTTSGQYGSIVSQHNVSNLESHCKDPGRFFN
jgi:hypothetical protein